MEKTRNKCDVCGETEFTVKEGYYFCDECGAQSQHIRDFDIDQSAIEAGTQAFFSSHKVTKSEIEKQQLTTWECFNYYLRSLVEELLQFGAKEEIKLTVLQLWTTYLRKTEVAFFSVKSAELPKLGPKYCERDARILYNHRKPKEKRTRGSSISSEKRKWSAQKKKFAKAEYVVLSQQSKPISARSSSQTSSTSGVSNRPIRLKLSREGRRYYKRYMSANHLNRHEGDGAYELKCHTLHDNKFPGVARPEALSRKTIFSLIYLALNLIGDDTQLCDLIRFCREGLLSTSKLYELYPENIARDCSEVISMKKHHGWNCFRNRALRETTAQLTRFIHIPELKLPNLLKLSKRFIEELSLPGELITYIERLYNLHPPQMNYKIGDIITPCYEGRAMAYVIFVLKLIFVLDDESELIISNAAKTINAELRNLDLQDKQIFIWEDWVKYIEMRKIILTQCHHPTSIHLGENVNYNQFIDHMRQSNESLHHEVLRTKRNVLLTVEEIFETLHDTLVKKRPKESIPSLKCPPSYTPFTSYLRYILNDITFTSKLVIPEFMHNNPCERDIKPFIYAKELKSVFAENNVKLLVRKISITAPRKSIGIFKSYLTFDKLKMASAFRFRRLDYCVNEAEWVADVKSGYKPPTIFSKVDSEFQQPKLHKSFKRSKTDLREMVVNKKVCGVQSDTATVHSFNVFSEQNMDPLPENDIGDEPRQFQTESILTNLTDEEDENDECNAEASNTDSQKVVVLKVSSFDCWNLTGTSKYLHVDEIQTIERKLPKAFYWLLKTCAEIAEIDTIDLYQEVLAIENQFTYALEPLNEFRDVLSYVSRKRDKDLEKVIEYYKTIW